MTRKPIWNLHGGKMRPSRICDVLIENNRIMLEIKKGRNEYETVPWQDVVSQVEEAKEHEREIISMSPGTARGAD